GPAWRTSSTRSSPGSGRPARTPARPRSPSSSGGPWSGCRAAPVSARGSRCQPAGNDPGAPRVTLRQRVTTGGAEHVRNPEELYSLREELPELDRPVLVQALTGFVDAGAATRLAREQLLTALDSEEVGWFDVDELYDYRSRRPTMLFVEDHWEHYDSPQLTLHAVTDTAGTRFLLLTGAEPDLRWEAFVAALVTIVDRLSVRLAV